MFSIKVNWKPGRLTSNIEQNFMPEFLKNFDELKTKWNQGTSELPEG